MKGELINKLGKGALWTLLVSVVGVYAFYILYNAEWLIGDDAFMLRRTAFGIPFPFSESILPETGFFRPFDYLHENIVLLFHSGMHNAFEHYIINAVSFILCMSAFFGVLWMTEKPKDVLDYAIVVFGVIALASRLIGVYINIFGPIFGVYTYHALAIFFLCVFLAKEKTWAMVLSLLCWTYSMLIYENVCMVIGCMGLFPLLFAYKRMTKKQIIYNFTLIGLAIAFIIAYLIIIYFPSRGMSFYDPAHNTGIGLLENAWIMLKGQKFIWVAAAIWLWRQIQILRKQTIYHILYDTLLWAAGGVVIGAVALRLNWTMYYYDAIILSLPAVVYFLLESHEKYGEYVALGLVALFAVWHSVNVPYKIKKNQKDRVETAYHMQLIADKVVAGWSVVWCDGEENEDYADEIMKVFRKEVTRNYIQYLLKNQAWNYDEEIKGSTIVFRPQENKNWEVSSACTDVGTKIGVTSGVYYYVIQ